MGEGGTVKVVQHDCVSPGRIDTSEVVEVMVVRSCGRAKGVEVVEDALEAWRSLGWTTQAITMVGRQEEGG